MNIEKYLERIHYKGNLIPNLEVLQALQKAHFFNIPFENLDIHISTKISLNIDSFYKKIVLNNRGGFCYELNGLFNTLLLHLGFKTKIISARVYNGQTKLFGKEFDHLAILVELNQVEYLVDVGFGEFIQYPLMLELDKTQTDPKGIYIVQNDLVEGLIVSKTEDEILIPQYAFSKKERNLMDFEEMCQYHQTSPNSHFTQKKLISLPTEKGRMTISGNTLKITEENKILKEIIFAENEFDNYVLNWFGIDLKKTLKS